MPLFFFFFFFKSPPPPQHLPLPPPPPPPALPAIPATNPETLRTGDPDNSSEGGPDMEANWANDGLELVWEITDRKSTRLNSSHSQISYAVFCLKKKKNLALAATLTLLCPARG